MKRAIFSRLILLTCVAIVICLAVSAIMNAVSAQRQTEEWLSELTISTAENYKYNKSAALLSESAGGNRVTIIAADGTVLDDSERPASSLENHANREEVQYARANGVYIVTRTSDTFGMMYMYASVVTEDGSVLRLAHIYSGLIENLIAQLPALIIAVIVALLLSLLLANRFAKTASNPLEKVVDALSTQEYAVLEDFKSPYYEIDKMMVNIQGFLETIAESNKNLHDEREKVEYILSHMAEGFILLDSDKNVLLCNISARRFFSYESDHGIESIYNLTRNKSILTAIQSALEGGQSSVFDQELREDLVVNVFISPSVVAEGEIGATVLIVDMTASKQLEQQKRDFFSNASHELKTPITSIRGFLEMLNKNLVTDEEEKASIMSRVEKEAQRLSELIDGILTISRLESDSVRAEYTDIKLSDVVRDAVSSLVPAKDATSIEITLDLNDFLYRANLRQMYELFVNLIENALKYNKPQGTIFISLKQLDGDVVFTVRDTGIGIPPEYQARVFERFFRANHGRVKKTEGTGLGLSIVKHIVSMYGGKISLVSVRDEGTTVIVSLPKINSL